MQTSTQTKQYPVTHTDAEWRKLLSPEQYAVMREHGTERPGSCALNYEKRAGTFTCVGCGQTLFKSKTKFESGTGWPSFNDPEAGATETTDELELRHGPHRGALQPLRQPSRPRLPRRPAADAPALLHQWRRDEFQGRVRRAQRLLSLSPRAGRGSANSERGAGAPVHPTYLLSPSAPNISSISLRRSSTRRISAPCSGPTR